jgi:hypothetical protein
MSSRDTDRLSSTERLAELVRAKHACLTQLHGLGKRQLIVIADGDISLLLNLLSAKQSLLAELQTIERGLDPFRQQDPDERRWASATDRQRSSQVLEQCEMLLKDILAQEKQSEQQLCQRRDEAAARLQGSHLAFQARGAYHSDPGMRVGQLDLSTES